MLNKRGVTELMELNRKTSSGADKLFVNGTIYSIDDRNRIYQAMAIKNGNIIALGSNEEISNYSNEKTEIVLLKTEEAKSYAQQASNSESQSLLYKEAALIASQQSLNSAIRPLL